MRAGARLEYAAAKFLTEAREALAEQLLECECRGMSGTDLPSLVLVFRKTLDLTLAQFADCAGVSAGEIQKIEAGHVNIEFKTLVGISRACGLPVMTVARCVARSFE